MEISGRRSSACQQLTARTFAKWTLKFFIRFAIGYLAGMGLSTAAKRLKRQPSLQEEACAGR
jgi:hypothetical protein